MEETNVSSERDDMIATEYRMRLKDKLHLGGDTTAFYFEKPPGFEFTAGQYVDITLINPPQTDPDGNTRSFSIASAPSEEHILVVTRIRNSAFKRTLQDLPCATEVEMDGPFGSFALHRQPAKPAIFLAGGIGVAPFSSMILSAAIASLHHQLYLFYSNPHPQDAAFLNGLRKLERKILNFRLIPTMTEMSKPQLWAGETGCICPEMLSRYLPRLQGPTYYLAGSPCFVANMSTMLKCAGIDESDMRCEDFVGY
jgi:ferredoxin-NADP reductase